MTRYRKSRIGVKARRAAIERLLDAMHWPWDSGLSLLLDAAVIAEEGEA